MLRVYSLVLSRESRKIVYRVYMEIIFPYSLLGTGKFTGVEVAVF